ncbi:MAG: hypothetical protein IJM31_08535 [Campylobacter sp.]|nr:hypothetical protein [Campylobacter sp.]
MIEKLKNLKENFEPNIDAVKFSQNLPKIKELFLSEFKIISVIFLCLFFEFSILDLSKKWEILLILTILAIGVRLLFQAAIYIHAGFMLKMKKFSIFLLLFEIFSLYVIFETDYKNPMKSVFIWIFILIPYFAIPIFHKNQILLFSMSRNYAFIISAIFSYICSGMILVGLGFLVMTHLFSYDAPLEDLWFFLIFILSALLASAFDLIGIFTMKFKKVSKISVYTHFGVVYILAFALWVGLIMLPDILEKSNYHLFCISKELFIKLFF